jgi:lipopolysaccharide/colanic/teichoic acid biosynthesis glycosyltransferase
MYKKVFKRLFDIIIASIFFILLLPIFIVVFIVIKMEDRGPIFFFQDRTGKDGKTFKMFKFRSMTVETTRNGKKLTHNERVTKVGRVLRKTSIDEFPQVINVLKGEMSIIGPRPWISEYYERFNEHQKHRCDVLPGITGLAQVNGRNGLSIFDKIKYDIEYAKNVSFIMDLMIIAKTIIIVFKKEHSEIMQEDIQDELNLLSSHS